ncbi:hypothetical protein [Pseudoruegeria sp. SK021]|uniref:hypothetical protein n=1 Tax=Pseudoruegeria sp. SK021 TaxID=1933035 RepID=UPI00111C6050|nr:hypothetical protein [Pseudoruegeria sp. SK021]
MFKSKPAWRNFGLKINPLAKRHFNELAKDIRMLEATANPALTARRAPRQELARLAKLLRDRACQV